MQSTITRLALFQFLSVFYCILVNGVILKVRFGSPAPAILATYLRDYGVFLLLLPAAWLIWASVSAHDPRVGTGDLPSILGSGLILLGVLVFVALLGTGSAMSHRTLVQAVPRSEPSTTASQ
jgi:hypothetical protein